MGGYITGTVKTAVYHYKREAFKRVEQILRKRSLPGEWIVLLFDETHEGIGTKRLTLQPGRDP